MGVFKSAVDVIFTDPNLSSEATYTPPGGSAETIRVTERREEVEIEFESSRVNTDNPIFEIRKSEVSQPVEGATLVVEGVSYVIQGDPQTKDSDRLVWQCSCVRS